MCGIVGIIGENNKGLIRKMNDAQFHRGPDDEGYYSDKNVELGMRRLAIIDLKGGKQPIHNEDETVWIIFNGEIYNYKELRNKLKNHKFYTNSDTEVIIHAYEEWGIESLNKLDGMFAFAIWNAEKKILILARDSYGKKPLYYTLKDGILYFSSEIKSILVNEEIRRKINLQALHDYLTFRYVPGNDTAIIGIKQLPPGHCLTFNLSDIAIRKYYEPPETRDGLRTLFHEAVKKRLIADVPLGVFLSGGIDSSSIVAEMKTITENVKTFTIGFNEVGDEIENARTVAEYCDTDHTEIIIDYNKMIKKLPEIIKYNDDLLADTAMIPTYFLSKKAREKVKVVLVGEGSDEIFGGYLQYRILKRIEEYPAILKDSLYQKLAFPFNEKQKNKVYMKKLKVEDSIRKHFPSDITLKKAMQFDLKNLNKYQLARVDKITMANSIEARAPYLDKKMTSYVNRLNDKYKIDGNASKIVLKEMMQGKLPSKIIEQKKKPFFTPLTRWYGSGLKDYLQEVFSNENSNIFIEEKVMELAEKNNPLRKNLNPYKATMILLFELWYKEFIWKH